MGRIGAALRTGTVSAVGEMYSEEPPRVGRSLIVPASCARGLDVGNWLFFDITLHVPVRGCNKLDPHLPLLEGVIYYTPTWCVFPYSFFGAGKTINFYVGVCKKTLHQYVKKFLYGVYDSTFLTTIQV